jgi:FkbM family methyltransferase
MLALLPNLLSHSSESINTVLHIGAGAGSELDTYQQLACEKIVAIEPDAALFKKLSTKARRFSNVETSQTWIGEKSTKAEAQIFANPRFNSLLSAGTLLEYFANLSQPKITEVNTLSLSDFFSTKLTLDRRKQNILVIEVQGFEVRLLQACEASLLQQFSLIIVRTSAEMLYQDGANAEQLSTCLNEKSFDLMLSDTSDLPYVEHCYRLDQSQITLTNNQKEHGKQQQQNLEKINHLSEQLAKQTQVLTGIQAHEIELQQSLAGKNEKLTSLSVQLAQENEKVGALQSGFEQAETEKSALQAQCGELSTLKAELENQLSQKTKGLTEQAQKQQEAKQQSEALKIQNDKLSADSTQQQTKNEQLLAQVTALQTKHNELAESQKNKDGQIAELTKERDHQSQVQQETKQRAEALKAQNDKLSADSTQQQTKNEQLLAQVTALRTKQDELANGHKNKDGQIAELTKERNQQSQGLKETKQQADALKTQNDNLSAQSTEQQTENEQLLTQVTALQTKHNELAESQKNKDGQIAELTKERDQQSQVQQETKQRAEALKIQNDKLSADSTQQQTKNEQLLAQVTALRTKQDELVDSHKNKDAQIAELTKERNQQSQVQQETKQRAEALKAQNDKLSADSTQQQTKNEQLLAQVAALRTKQDELVNGHKNKDAQIITVTEQRDKESHWHQENKNWAESLNKQCEEQKVYSAERQKSADLALRLQAKAQLDLDNLREKYQVKHNSEQQLVDLVSELRAKLQQAAEYYYELQEEHPELSEATPNRLGPSQIEDYGSHNVAGSTKKIQTKGKKTKISKRAKTVTRGKL